jgi:HK97 family phage major capsid protein
MSTFVNMGRADAVRRLEDIQTRMERLGAKHRLSTTEQREFDQLAEEFEDYSGHVDRLDRRVKITEDIRTGRVRTERGSVGAEDTPATGHRDAALRTLERAVTDERVAPAGAEMVETLLGAGSPLSQSWTARWTVATGNPAYERAFAKKLSDPENGHLTWTAEEADAWRVASMVQTEQRAMSLTDSAGGHLVPFTLDPAVTITGAGSINPLRQIARVVQTATDSWNGVTSAGVTAEWLDEATEAADAAPTLGAAPIPVHKASAWVPYSFEVGMDGANFLSELGRLLLDSYDQLTAAAYTTGSGTGQPKGIVTALAAASGTVALITPAAAETLTAPDVFAVQNALPPRFQPNASWTANLGVINTLRQLETTNGALRFPSLQETPPSLLGRMVYENSSMDATWNTAATASNYVLIYGDYGQGMVICDRIGATLETVPHVFGANQRPTGQRGALLWARTGSDVVAPQAFRMFNLSTAA